jgi:hypothetical protein
MTGAISLLYEIDQKGWAALTLTVGDQSIQIGKFGYCTDALGDLLRNALVIVTGATFATVSFDSESVEWRLILGEWWPGLPVSDLIPISIRTFPDLSDNAPEEKGLLLFENKVQRDAYGRAVLRAALDIWEGYGAKGYSKAWDFTFGRFPLRAMRALETALSTQEPVILASASE